MGLLGGRQRSQDPRWTGQIRPLVDTANPAISGVPRRELSFYLTAPCVGKVVWTLVRQLRGPHFSTCA